MRGCGRGVWRGRGIVPGAVREVPPYFGDSPFRAVCSVARDVSGRAGGLMLGRGVARGSTADAGCVMIIDNSARRRVWRGWLAAVHAPRMLTADAIPWSAHPHAWKESSTRWMSRLDLSVGAAWLARF